MANVLNNAVKYTDAGGRIGLSAERENDQVLIRVRDSGIGMSQETLPHIFELFVQSERGLDRSQGGLGIRSDSGQEPGGDARRQHHRLGEGPGRGSEFVVSLEHACRAAIGPAPDRTKKPRTRSLRRPGAAFSSSTTTLTPPRALQCSCNCKGIMLTSSMTAERFRKPSVPIILTSSSSISDCPAWTALRSPASCGSNTRGGNWC